MQISNPYLSKYILPQVSGESVLDVGCGAGLYGFLLKYSWYRTAAIEPFKKIDAVEFSDETVAELKMHNLYNNVFHCNAAILPVPDNSYDTVLSIECLEHLYVEDLHLAISELYRVCKNKLIISTPPSSLCHNAPWCEDEIKRFEKLEFVSYSFYNEYVNTLHKCAINSDVFLAMGFRTYAISPENAMSVQNIENETRVYFGDKSKIDLKYFKISHGTYKKNVPKIDGKNYKEEIIDALNDQLDIKVSSLKEII